MMFYSMIQHENLYCYEVSKVVKIIDGDTVDVLIDLGFDVHIKGRVRLSGINAPESRTRDKEEKKKGLAAKARLKELCKNKILLKSYGKEKYGRILGELFVDGASLNTIMIAEGHAKKYDGGKR